jgi:membrane protease subunit HflK
MQLGQDKLKQAFGGGGSRNMIVIALLALLGLGAWSAFYTVPSDSVAVIRS